MDTLPRNRLTSLLGIEHPFVQGPFGGGLSTARLAAAVSARGALGSFGAHHLTAQAIVDTARDIRALTDRPFALNLWISSHDPGGLEPSEAEYARHLARFEPYYRELGIAPPPRPNRTGERFEDQVHALIEARPAVFSFVFGVPSREILAACRRANIITVGAATTIAEARALEDAGVDALVATGFEAGGHRPSFLAPAEESLMGTFALTRLIASRVRIPVIAAGGIADRAGIEAALTLGAEGAQLGTAFLACEESNAMPEHRELLFGEDAQHTTLTRAYTGRLARGLRNRWSREMSPPTNEVAPYPLQSFLAGHLKPAARQAGRTDVVSLWSGQIAPLLRHRRVDALIDDLLTPRAR